MSRSSKLWLGMQFFAFGHVIFPIVPDGMLPTPGILLVAAVCAVAVAVVVVAIVLVLFRLGSPAAPPSVPRADSRRRLCGSPPERGAALPRAPASRARVSRVPAV